jgi:hypothetical protein
MINPMPLWGRSNRTVDKQKTEEISEKELHENFAESYGNFSGKAIQRAKLRFTPEVLAPANLKKGL